MMLYHGSNTDIERVIRPSISFDMKPYVYATDDYEYALVRCGRFKFEDVSIKEEYLGKDDVYTLVELRDGAFADVFNVSGYIYTLPQCRFIGKGDEFISETPVEFTNKLYIPNVWSAMNSPQHRNRYRLISYKDRDTYFRDNNMDMAAYMQRRQSRIAQIKQMKIERSEWV